MRRLAVLVLVACAWAGRATADPTPEGPGVSLERLFPGATFDPSVPTQEAVLGFRPGARPIRHDELMRYVDAVANATKRVRVLPYATTWEGRPLVAIAVGDEATIASLDTFREEHAALMDPRSAAAVPTPMRSHRRRQSHGWPTAFTATRSRPPMRPRRCCTGSRRETTSGRDRSERAPSS